MMNRHCFAALAVSLTLTSCASLPTPSDHDTVGPDTLPRPTDTLHYHCRNGETLQVAHFQPAEGDGMVALVYRGTLHLLRPWPAASGERYVSIDEQVGLRWHTKGREGLLQRLAADHTAEVTTLLSGCRLTP